MLLVVGCEKEKGYEIAKLTRKCTTCEFTCIVNYII